MKHSTKLQRQSISRMFASHKNNWHQWGGTMLMSKKLLVSFFPHFSLSPCCCFFYVRLQLFFKKKHCSDTYIIIPMLVLCSVIMLNWLSYKRHNYEPTEMCSSHLAQLAIWGSETLSLSSTRESVMVLCEQNAEFFLVACSSHFKKWDELWVKDFFEQTVLLSTHQPLLIPGRNQPTLLPPHSATAVGLRPTSESLQGVSAWCGSSKQSKQVCTP